MTVVGVVEPLCKWHIFQASYCSGAMAFASSVSSPLDRHSSWSRVWIYLMDTYGPPPTTHHRHLHAQRLQHTRTRAHTHHDHHRRPGRLLPVAHGLAHVSRLW